MYEAPVNTQGLFFVLGLLLGGYVLIRVLTRKQNSSPFFSIGT